MEKHEEYYKKEKNAAALSGFGVLLLFIGIILLFINWKVGLILIVLWWIIVSIATKITPARPHDLNKDK